MKFYLWKFEVIIMVVLRFYMKTTVFMTLMQPSTVHELAGHIKGVLVPLSDMGCIMSLLW